VKVRLASLVDRPWFVPVLSAVWGTVLSLLAQRLELTSLPDFFQFWAAGRAVVHGQDPYPAVLSLHQGYPYFYPYPAALVAAPLGLLPWRVALVLFVALSAAALGIATKRFGRGLGPALLSASFINAAVEGQWSPLLTAAAVVPWLAWLLTVKPSVGLALWISRPSRAAVIGGAALVVASLILQPSWPLTWVQALHASNHVAPLLRPGGWLLLLAAIRWRTPEGRLLTALACIPHTSSLFETLPLFLIPRTRTGGYLLAMLSFVALVAKELTLRGSTLEARIDSGWPALFVCLWLPALVLVLWRRAEPV
jgi:hypothetical protein